MKRRFGHWNIRAVTYDALLLADRRTIHRRIAESLEAASGDDRLYPDDDALSAAVVRAEAPTLGEGDVAAHWLACGEARRGALHLVRSSASALSLGRSADARTSAMRAIEIFSAGLDPLASAKAATIAASALERTGRYGDSVAMLQDAIRAAATDETTLGAVVRASARATLGFVLIRMSRLAEAEQVLFEGRDEARRVGSDRAEASCLNQIGTLFASRNRQAEARTFYAQALELRRKLGDRRGEAAVANNLALADWRLGTIASARRQFISTLALWRECGDRVGESSTLNNLGAILARLGEFDEGLRVLEEARSLCREAGDVRGLASAAGSEATIHLERGDPKASLRVIGTVFEILRELSAPELLFDALGTRAAALLAEGDFEGARRDAAYIVSEAADSGDIENQAAGLAVLAEIESDPAKGQQAVALARRVGDPYVLANSLLSLHAAAHRSDPALALRAVQEALAIAREGGMAGVLQRAEAALARTASGP